MLCGIISDTKYNTKMNKSYHYTTRPTQKKSDKRKAIILVAISLLLAIMLGFGFLKLIKKTDPVSTEPSTSASEDEQEVESGVSAKNQSSISASGTNKDSGVQSTNGPTPPKGNFVSSHNPPSSGTNIESVCVTSAGASCEIIFSRNGVTKSLNSQPVDNNGATTWIWNTSQLGLTTGSWEITAKATYNGKSAETQDPLNLEVP